MPRLRRRVRAALQTLGKQRGLVVLVVLVVLVGGGYTLGAYGATSLEITVWTHVMYVTVQPGQQAPVFPPDRQIFDQTITDVGLVHDTQLRLDGLKRFVSGGCAMASPAYIYAFRLATFGVTTEVYTGNLDCTTWTVTTLGVPVDVAGADSAVLYGYNLMTTLRKLTGMPLPSWWSATLPAS